MGMRRSTRQELRMLRGIVRSVFEDVKCFFCREPLLAGDNFYEHGAGEGSPIDVPLTEHHINGKHEDNRKSNRAWAHRRCHKAYHLWLRHKEEGKRTKPWKVVLVKLKKKIAAAA